METKQDVANVLRQQAETINVLVHLDFDKSKVVEAVVAGDLTKLLDGPPSPTV